VQTPCDYSCRPLLFTAHLYGRQSKAKLALINILLSWLNFSVHIHCRTVYVVYGCFGDLNIYTVGGDEYDELGCKCILKILLPTMM
jgi:hypothetical protein